MLDALENQANLISLENQTCSQCDEPVIFVLKDNYHEFSLNLSTLLQCLKFAETEGSIPAIPQEWWDNISTRYQY